MIGIIGAMDEEVAMLKEKLTEVQVETKAAMDFYKGKLEGKDVVVVRSGIGKVNAAMCAQILADVYHADHVINTGIAGSLKAEINIGDIVLSRVDTLSFKADEKMLSLAKECCEKVNPEIGVFTGRVVSGDQFISDKEKKKWLTDTFAGYCTEMEGAAIAQVCYFNHIPFLIVRAISDKADDSASMDYPTFEAQAIRHSVNLMAEMIRCF